MTTAVEKLLMLGGSALIRLYRLQIYLRLQRKPETIDPDELQELGEEFTSIAWNMKSGRAMDEWGSEQINEFTRNRIKAGV